MSLSVSPLAASVVMMFTEVAQDPFVPLRESVAPGGVISRIPVSTMPDATTWLAIAPEYTTPLKLIAHSLHAPLAKESDNEPDDSHPLAEVCAPVAVLPEPSIAVRRNVFPGSSVPLNE